MGICSDKQLTSKICGIYLSGFSHVVTFIWIMPSSSSDNLQGYLQSFASKFTICVPTVLELAWLCWVLFSTIPVRERARC